MRVKSEIWVKAYLRRASSAGAPALIARRGHSDAGAIFVKVNLLDGRVVLYGPAPAGLSTADGDRLWVCSLGSDAVPEADADSYLRRQAEFDPDFWVVEVEDRGGRHFLGSALVSL